MNRISIIRNGETLQSAASEGEALLYFHEAYQPGDSIAFESAARHAIVRIDHTVAPARVYLPEQKFTFRLPLEGDLPRMYPPFAFKGDRHLITLKDDADNEYRNLACNPADQRHESGAYPARLRQCRDPGRKPVFRPQRDRRRAYRRQPRRLALWQLGHRRA